MKFPMVTSSFELNIVNLEIALQDQIEKNSTLLNDDDEVEKLTPYEMGLLHASSETLIEVKDYLKQCFKRI